MDLTEFDNLILLVNKVREMSKNNMTMKILD